MFRRKWRKENWKGRWMAVKRDNGEIVTYMPWSNYIRICKNRRKIQQKFIELSSKLGSSYAKGEIIKWVLGFIGIPAYFSTAVGILLDEILY